MLVVMEEKEEDEAVDGWTGGVWINMDRFSVIEYSGGKF